MFDQEDSTAPMKRSGGIQDEPARAAATIATGLLEGPDHEAFDSLVRLAGQVTGAPMAAFTVLTSDRQFLRARSGIDVSETPREWAFCNHTVLGDELVWSEDTRGDPRFCSNPLVAGPPGIRFYAGVPVVDAQGYRIGALCVLDSEPRSLSTEQASALKSLAQMLSEEVARVCKRAATAA